MVVFVEPRVLQRARQWPFLGHAKEESDFRPLEGGGLPVTLGFERLLWEPGFLDALFPLFVLVFFGPLPLPLAALRPAGSAKL